MIRGAQINIGRPISLNGYIGRIKKSLSQIIGISTFPLSRRCESFVTCKSHSVWTRLFRDAEREISASEPLSRRSKRSFEARLSGGPHGLIYPQVPQENWWKHYSLVLDLKDQPPGSRVPAWHENTVETRYHMSADLENA